ncbi:hypothetical protein C8Q76DRAFT_747768 [Earliella scabrosa]|nr:hypothetical protein C8Q76DRAFT_747768 [Earliella scabrosa]
MCKERRIALHLHVATLLPLGRTSRPLICGNRWFNALCRCVSSILPVRVVVPDVLARRPHAHNVLIRARGERYKISGLYAGSGTQPNASVLPNNFSSHHVSRSHICLPPLPRCGGRVRPPHGLTPIQHERPVRSHPRLLRLKRDRAHPQARPAQDTGKSHLPLRTRPGVRVPRLPPRPPQHPLRRDMARHRNKRAQHHVPPLRNHRAHRRVLRLPLRRDVLGRGLPRGPPGLGHHRACPLRPLLCRVHGQGLVDADPAPGPRFVHVPSAAHCGRDRAREQGGSPCGSLRPGCWCARALAEGSDARGCACGWARWRRGVHCRCMCLHRGPEARAEGGSREDAGSHRVGHVVGAMRGSLGVTGINYVRMS